MKISLSETKWPEEISDVEAFKHGSMSLLRFTPRVKDYQTPHEQDELYIIMKGKGELLIEGERFSFNEGDALFVRAGKEHKFDNFSDDLLTWVVFWGPKGGEK